ncbi:hypothetical protein PDE_07704 [Penicillium oxalicum 114-2]|uniref:Uncharacterized protein n=1 Tax=Penicillium oxalicum (strain 114-2 / CGMCC 5302) TaxID=933388 RepID=S7ZQR0_PENO1|nr:hypothetical protein PDE_07704 [Penicillium oxalicum 114-2]
MDSAWPQPSFVNTKFNDVFQFAEIFEKHCAQVYSHATQCPEETVRSEYMIDLVSQAYRAVRSLHLHQMGRQHLDTNTAIAALKSRSTQQRRVKKTRTLNLQPTLTTEESKCRERELKRDIDDLFTAGPDDENEDPDWCASSEEEETEDEYYEYHEESESDNEHTSLTHRMHRVRTIHELPEDDVPELSRSPPIELAITQPDKDPNEASTMTPPVMLTEEQIANDRITAALQRISEKFEDAESVPLTRVSARVNRPLQPTPPSTDDSNSEATTIRPESGSEPLSLLHTATDDVSSSLRLTTRAAHGEVPTEQQTSSEDAHLGTARPGRLTRRASVTVLPRRIKTVCHRYVRRAMLPLRGKTQ